MNGDIILIGTIASLVAGLATGFGALPVLFTKRISDRLLDTMLGFAAGVMLTATSFSLLVPSLDLGGAWVAVFGILLGAVVLYLIDRFIPHFSPAFGTEGLPSRRSPRLPKEEVKKASLPSSLSPSSPSVIHRFSMGDAGDGIFPYSSGHHSSTENNFQASDLREGANPISSRTETRRTQKNKAKNNNIPSAEIRAVFPFDSANFEQL